MRSVPYTRAGLQHLPSARDWTPEQQLLHPGLCRLPFAAARCRGAKGRWCFAGKVGGERRAPETGIRSRQNEWKERPLTGRVAVKWG